MLDPSRGLLAALLALATAGTGTAASGSVPPLPARHWIRSALATLPFPGDAPAPDRPLETRLDAAAALVRWLTAGAPARLTDLPDLLVTELRPPSLAALGLSPERQAELLAARSAGAALLPGDPGAARLGAALERLDDLDRQLEALRARAARQPGRP